MLHHLPTITLQIENKYAAITRQRIHPITLNNRIKPAFRIALITNNALLISTHRIHNSDIRMSRINNIGSLVSGRISAPASGLLVRDDDMMGLCDLERGRDGDDGSAEGGVCDERARIAAEEIDAEIHDDFRERVDDGRGGDVAVVHGEDVNVAGCGWRGAFGCYENGGGGGVEADFGCCVWWAEWGGLCLEMGKRA